MQLQREIKILNLTGRNKAYKENTNNTAVQTIVQPHLEYCMVTWRPYRKKDKHKLERKHYIATKMKLKLNITKCAWKKGRLGGTQVKVFNIFNGYENKILINSFSG